MGKVCASRDYITSCVCEEFRLLFLGNYTVDVFALNYSEAIESALRQAVEAGKADELSELVSVSVGGVSAVLPINEGYRSLPPSIKQQVLAVVRRKAADFAQERLETFDHVEHAEWLGV